MPCVARRFHVTSLWLTLNYFPDTDPKNNVHFMYISQVRCGVKKLHITCCIFLECIHTWPSGKLPNWMSKNCQKLDIFFKKIDKNCHFFQQNCHWDKSLSFQDKCSHPWWAKMCRKYILKSPGFVPIGLNLSQIWHPRTKCTIANEQSATWTSQHKRFAI